MTPCSLVGGYYLVLPTHKIRVFWALCYKPGLSETELLIAIGMVNAVMWYVAPCSLVGVY
jgi:hypothetical protein